MQPVSPRSDETVAPSRNMPDSLTSEIASSAPAAMSLANDSSGPVKPSRMPIFVSSACAPVASKATAVVAINIFFIWFSPLVELSF